MSSSTGARSIRARVTKLEQATGQTANRLIVISAGERLSEGDVTAFLKRKGIVAGPHEMVVRLTTFYETKPGDPARAPSPPSLLAVHRLRQAA